MPNYVFNEETTRRIARAVRRVEAASRSGGTHRRRHITGTVSGLKLVVLTSDLSYQGSATANILVGTPFNETDSGVEITVYDLHMSNGDPALPAGSIVTVGKINGYWRVIGSACPT